jgi:uncharacterized protein YeeX (DUF496 family)
MARSVKKVRKPKTKKFWIILGSSIAVVIIGLVVGLLVAYVKGNTAELTNTFENYTKYKINYNELENIIEDKKEEYYYKEMFVFVYDSSYVFDEPKGVEKTDPTYKTYQNYVKASEKIEELRGLIEKVNEKKKQDQNSYLTGFYVINASLNTNSSALANAEYESFTSPALLTFYIGAGNDKLSYVKSSEEITATKYNTTTGEEATFSSLSRGSSTGDLISAIDNVEDYLEYSYGVSLK